MKETFRFKGRNMQQEKKYFFFAFLVVLIILSYLIVKPYVVALISAFILAYLLKPLNDKLKSRIRVSSASLISVLLAFVLLILPAVLVIKKITQQSYIYFSSIALKDLLLSLSQYFPFQNFQIDKLTDSGVQLIFGLFTKVASYLPSFFLSLFITLFGAYYVLANWEKLSESVLVYLPIKNKKEFTGELTKVTNSLIYGTLLIAIIEFVIAAAGFYIAKSSLFLFLALLVMLFAFIPALGPAIVWVPLLIYNLAIKNYFSAVAVLATGAVLSLYVDTIFRSKFLSKKTKINPLIMLVGILGGVSVFGIFGFIIGPLVLFYTLEFLEDFLRDS